MEKEQFYRARPIIKDIEYIEWDLKLLKKEVLNYESFNSSCLDIEIINRTEKGTGERIPIDWDDKKEILRRVIKNKEKQLQEFYEQLKAI